VKELILLGGGGHCKSCIDVIEETQSYKVIGILDKQEFVGQFVLGYEIIASDDEIPNLVKQEVEFLVTVGQIKTAQIRKMLYYKLLENQAALATVISPRAHVSKYAKISAGSIVMHDALINANATVGYNCIINSKALIEHDAVVGDHCHISTAAIINGGSHIGDTTFFGSNAVSREYAVIPDDSFIKAGTVFK